MSALPLELQAAAAAATRGPARSIGAGSIRPTSSPISPQQHILTNGGRNGASGRKRTIESAFGSDVKIETPQHSPDSLGEGFDDKDESRIGVKRACNECRQQKLRCDVVQEPFESCSRCKRCHLDCRIDSNFKRVGKRKRNAEMEREIQDLRNQLAHSQTATSSPVSQAPGVPQNSFGLAQPTYGQPVPQISPSPLDQYMGSHEAVASLLDLKSGGDAAFKRSPQPNAKPSRRLEGVVLTGEQIEELFRVFFAYYHPLQPLLEVTCQPEQCFTACPLLFWVIISVGARKHAPWENMLQDLSKGLQSLLWAVIADVPQTHLVVKALCILCVWPLPISSTSSDSTFMISGLMLQIAMQIGLHRPSHAQDFSKLSVELREEELRDRVKTWAACNVVAQRVATGFGQPASTHYDWTLQPIGNKEHSFKLPDEMDARLRIEMFCNKITTELYSNTTDPVGLANDNDKGLITENLVREYGELENNCEGSLSSLNVVYLKAANLHLRLSVFFDSPTRPSYQQDLLNLWDSTKSFLEEAFNLTALAGNIVKYSSNYILQMIIASGFTLLKLLNSHFAHLIDLEYGKALFTTTIKTIRVISVLNNDLPSRLAEVLAQLWRASGAGSPPVGQWDGTWDNSLQLKVCCRMSMSLVFDSVWRWREQFQDKNRDNLEAALKNPTNPESGNISTISTRGSQAPEGLMAPIPSKAMDLMLAPPSSSGFSRAPTPSADFGFADYNEVFDPLNWMLDGQIDFPYVFGDAAELDAGLGAM